MNQNVKDALSRVAERLKSLSKEEFSQKITTHSVGEIASALMNNHDFFQSNTVDTLKHMFLKVNCLNFSRQEFNYADFDRIEAANDNCFLMAV
jgi:hypothetical protein